MKSRNLLMISIIFMFVSFSISSLFAQNFKDIEKDVYGSIKTSFQEKEHFSLYDFVYKDFVKYYGRTNFSDPHRTNGWYRVDDFLKWLRENENILKQKFIENYTIENANSQEKKDFLKQLASSFTTREAYTYPPKNDYAITVLGGFLGYMYTASHFKNINSINPIGVVPDTFSRATVSWIEIEKSNNILIPINGGIHEGAHVLPYTCLGKKGRTPADNLSEVLPLASQMLFGLPEKGEKDYDPTGVRDLKFDLQNLSVSYGESILAFLQLDTFANIFNQGKIEGLDNLKIFYQLNYTIDSLIEDLIDIHKHHLKYNGNIIGFEEYTQILNVLPQNQEKIASWMEDIATKINKQKPFPICMRKRDFDEVTDCYNKYIDRNRQLIYNIMLEKLKDMPFSAYPAGLVQ